MPQYGTAQNYRRMLRSMLGVKGFIRKRKKNLKNSVVISKKAGRKKMQLDQAN